MKIFRYVFLGLLVFPLLAIAEAEIRRTPLEVGMSAPNFSLLNGAGEEVSLASFKGKNSVVLYFYPKDNTPGCTKEAQSFRDDFQKFKTAGAVVLGISVDDVDSHKSFSNKYNLNFPILADVGGSVSRLYGVMGWIMAKRVTYVIGRDGKIKFVDSNVDSHLSEQSKNLLKVVEDLAHQAKGGKAG